MLAYLRELEDDRFIHREIYKEIPTKVEYTLTEVGKSFVPILTQMMMWSQSHLCPPNYVSPYSAEQIQHLLDCK
jgi:DNA-binding HxlR family transcriptional regulator